MNLKVGHYANGRPGRVRYYRYNSVGLLVEVSDELGRILKKYTYDPNYIQL